VTRAPIGLDWTPREEPLVPRAVAAAGAALERLIDRLRQLPGDRLSRLEGVVGEDLLVVLGAADDLPWVDGVVYLGRSEQAPSLLLPTAVSPSIPESLLDRAVRLRAGSMPPPLAVLPDRALVASVAAARPLTAEAVAAAAIEAPGRRPAQGP
jgi:hypothetical protein